MKHRIFNWAIALVIAVFVFSALVFLSSRYVSATTGPSSQTINAVIKTLGALFTDISPNSITWSNYDTFTNYTNTSIIVNDKNGNLPGNILIWGSAQLTNATNGDSIAIGNVLWSPTLENTYTGTPVTTSPVDTATVVPAPSLSSPIKSSTLYLGVNIPPATPSGTYTGTLYFDIANGTTYSIQPSSNTLAVALKVKPTCFISLNPTSINFGSLVPTANTSTTWNGIVDTDNGGNAQATIYVSGTNWTFTSNPSIYFYVANTVWSSTNTGTYSSGTPLTLSAVSTGIIIPAPTPSQKATSNTIYFGAGIPGGAPVGSYTQNIIIANQC